MRGWRSGGVGGEEERRRGEKRLRTTIGNEDN